MLDSGFYPRRFLVFLRFLYREWQLLRSRLRVLPLVQFLVDKSDYYVILAGFLLLGFVAGPSLPTLFLVFLKFLPVLPVLARIFGVGCIQRVFVVLLPLHILLVLVCFRIGVPLSVFGFS